MNFDIAFTPKVQRAFHANFFITENIKNQLKVFASSLMLPLIDFVAALASRFAAGAAVFAESYKSSTRRCCNRAE